jgi:hypothetical protein
VTGAVDDRTLDSNESTRVARRFFATDWRKDKETLVMNYTFDANAPVYIRVRGTNTSELEPAIDPPDEDPWTDLWFYSNPVFVEVGQ